MLIPAQKSLKKRYRTSLSLTDILKGTIGNKEVSDEREEGI
jgi:hypothetical protein